MLNEWLLTLARWFDTQSWSTQIHESIYLYAWIETTHVLTLMVFLGMLFVIDLRMLGLIFPNVRASTIADRLDRPMMIGFAMMVISGLLLYYAIPVRTTQNNVSFTPHCEITSTPSRHPSPSEITTNACGNLLFPCVCEGGVAMTVLDCVRYTCIHPVSHNREAA